MRPIKHIEKSKKIEGGAIVGKRVIDVTCGSKMFWFDKSNPDVEFCDKRVVERQEYYPGRYITEAETHRSRQTGLPSSPVARSRRKGVSAPKPKAGGG